METTKLSVKERFVAIAKKAKPYALGFLGGAAVVTIATAIQRNSEYVPGVGDTGFLREDDSIEITQSEDGRSFTITEVEPEIED